MSTQAIRQAARTETWVCFACRDLVPNAETFIVGNKATGEAIVLHRACVASLLTARVSREQGKTQHGRRRRG
jgi:hypothetical protein